MRSDGIDAFLIPSGDSHQSEKISPADQRLKWASGFSGSAGFAVVTLKKAAVWVDGRSAIIPACSFQEKKFHKYMFQLLSPGG